MVKGEWLSQMTEKLGVHGLWQFRTFNYIYMIFIGTVQ